MQIKKLISTEYEKILIQPNFEIYSAVNKTRKNVQAVIFGHAQIDSDLEKSIEKVELQFGEISHLCPDNYELHTARGQLSDFQTAEHYDTCKKGEYYINYNLSPPQEDIFSNRNSINCNKHILTSNQNFDLIFITSNLTLAKLLSDKHIRSGYQYLLLHCSRCHKNADNIKYFLPEEQLTHI